MKKLGIISVLVATVFVFSSAVPAMAAMLIPASETGRDKANADVSPVIEKVGGHLVLSTPGLEKIVLIHYEEGFAKPPGVGGDKKESGYKLLGAKWKDLQVNYVIDPDNPYGLTEEFVVKVIHASAEEWDAHTSAELFGAYSIDYNASWDSSAPDGKNELLFGDYPEEGVIGITIVWGYFTGPPSTRRIIEFDVMFDTDFVWGDATGNSAVMDLQNIATHELGHGIGLADLYNLANSEQTMYGYSNYGEIKKRDLYTGDIAGIQALYGA
jgi:hypothetical protein